MPNRYVAIDPITGVTGQGRGIVVGVAATDAALDAAGFTRAAGYSGGRRRTVDDTTAAWNVDVEPGWYWDGTKLTATPLLSSLDQKKAALWRWVGQRRAWEGDVNREGLGQPASRVDVAHDLLHAADEGVYLIGNGLGTVNSRTGFTNTQIIAWLNAIVTGASDITSAFSFFAQYHGSSRTDAIAWADPHDASKTTLAGALTVTGTIPDGTNMADWSWIDALSS